ncbi:SubName: Full=Uncharacterized protein {ECO:0000313/EMBL:CCA66392.1} [Serendipita indica DSM 11827]|nr:SubName: Full=Uncharacterized protein {ECO:0000313/EMBL:CCA66392.1} [Serendipita indica DSM 11827]
MSAVQKRKVPQKNTKYKKAPPKPALSKEEKQRRYFGSLCDQLEGEHLANALKTTKKLLALDPADEEALQTQLFLLLKSSQYSEALKVTDANPEQFGFERAYALYRLQREQEAYELLGEVDEDDRAGMLLQAQINYRRGDYSAALEIYNSLLSTSHIDEYADIKTNMTAAETHLSFLQTGFLSSIQQLPPLPRNQSLEDAPLPSLHLTHTTQVDATVEPAPKPKAPRKSRIPKGVIPGVTPPPDPERWIKKSERTRVETGNKKKKGGATQGSTAPEPTQKSGGGGKSNKKKR